MTDQTLIAIEHAAEKIRTWAYTDSLVSISVRRIVHSLVSDHVSNGGHVPTDAECEDLVCGEPGEIEKAREMFPNTDELLASAIGG
jgi:hypothetical protein